MDLHLPVKEKRTLGRISRDSAAVDRPPAASPSRDCVHFFLSASAVWATSARSGSFADCQRWSILSATSAGEMRFSILSVSLPAAGLPPRINSIGVAVCFSFMVISPRSQLRLSLRCLGISGSVSPTRESSPVLDPSLPPLRIGLICQPRVRKCPTAKPPSSFNT